MQHYCERTLRRKAYAIGLCIEKGYQRCRHWNGYVLDQDGNKATGYQVVDALTRVIESDSYHEWHFYPLTLEEVEDYLYTLYQEQGLEW